MPRPPQPAQPQRRADQQRIDELKRQIQAGEYETSEKLDLTVTRLLADLRHTAAQPATDRPPAERPAASPEDDSGGARP